MKFYFIFMLLITAPLAFSTQVPPDYDFDYEFVHEAPAGLSAGWAGESVYLSWRRTKDKHDIFVTGYRLYRAQGVDSIFIPVRTVDENNLIYHAEYFDPGEDIERDGIVTSDEFFYKVTAVVIQVELDEDDEPTGVEYVYESKFSSPLAVKREIDLSCFISTAAYGTASAREVAVLSGFRDGSLQNGFAGRKFISAYEFLSPPAANIIAGSSFLRSIVRMHIHPAVTFLKALNL